MLVILLFGDSNSANTVKKDMNGLVDKKQMRAMGNCVVIFRVYLKACDLYLGWTK